MGHKKHEHWLIAMDIKLENFQGISGPVPKLWRIHLRLWEEWSVRVPQWTVGADLHPGVLSQPLLFLLCHWATEIQKRTFPTLSMPSYETISEIINPSCCSGFPYRSLLTLPVRLTCPKHLLSKAKGRCNFLHYRRAECGHLKDNLF